MGQAAIFAGQRTKLLSSKGLLLKDGTTIDNDGVVNFIRNNSGANGTIDWTEGSYTAASRPSGAFTASSGAGAFAISTTTTTPLGYGSTSFLLTKSSGASRQGRAIETSFVLPLSYRAKVLQLNIDYIINSGTFVAGSNSTDSSLIWYCAFSTDGGSTYTVAEPSSFKLLSNSTTISDKFSASIQTPSDATNMKLIAYVAETASSAWSVKFVAGVSPTVALNISTNGPVGSIIATGSLTPPTGYLYANGSAVSRTTYSELFKVIGTTYGVGDGSTTFNLPDLRGVFARGAGSQTIGAETYSATLGQKQNDATAKNGLALSDPGHKHYAAPDNAQFVGTGSGSSANIGGGAGYVIKVETSTNTTGITLGNGDAETRPANVAVAYHICFNAGSVQVSDGYDGRVVATKMYPSANLTVNPNATPVKVNINTALIDKAGSANTSLNRIDIKTSGVYNINGTIELAGTNVLANTAYRMFVYKNGSAWRYGGIYYAPINGVQVSLVADFPEEELIAGDYLEAYIYSNGNHSVNQLTIIATSSCVTSLAIEKLAGNPVISASETVAMNYTGAPPTGTLTNNTTQNTIFGTRRTDTNGIYNTTTGIATIPVAGYYTMQFKTRVNGTFSATGDSLGLIILNITTGTTYGNNVPPLLNAVLQGSALAQAVWCNAGDQIRTQVYVGGTGTGLSYSSVADSHEFSIVNVK